MKRILMVICVRLFVQLVSAQKMKESDVPQVVKAAFAKAYPKAKDVKWGKEDAAFEAGFMNDKKEMSVVLDAAGMIQEVETDIKMSELPSGVAETLKKEYADYKVTEVAKIVSNGVTTYETEVGKGKNSFDLIWDGTGKLVKKIEKKAEEKD